MGQLSLFQMKVISMFLLITSVKFVLGQISTPCTTSMISSFTPCANFITGSTNYNGLITPSSSCCDSLESMMSTSMDCACLLISANVPFQLLPINRLLSIFLPQACNLNGLPAQCKASGSPLPAPGPAIFGSNVPSLPPTNGSPLSPQADPKTIEISDAPKSTILHSTMAPAPAKLAPLKQIHPRKLQKVG
ncbi:non-specific lipid transfer protein GPI-anchored 16-like [Trifolium pratense]|uniref:non-specific lipid transfer protein GPI-anchored 16-like n=1 Tax=Trifolium pratense TaxID=57577 RepID=UPI001E695CA0|nr:non-specific lipid transfer protein GPI-anchored 16-like [Trifolium pratense]